MPIRRLLDGPDHAGLSARYFANQLRRRLLARTAVNTGLYAPQLEGWLARQFVAHRFDLKYLLRALTGSRAYQRTSRLTDPS
jgi:hypothetical protein